MNRTILECILPIPDGWKLVSIKDNEMTLIKVGGQE